MLPYQVISTLLFWAGLSVSPEPVYVLEKLNPRINTVYDEINPVISLDGKTMYFTRVGHPAFEKTLKVNESDYFKTLSFTDYQRTLKDIFISLGEQSHKSPTESSFNQDIWIAATENAPFDRVQHPKYPLNSALPNSVCAVTTDPSTVVIVNQFYKDGSMLKGFSFAKKNDDGWTFPEPLFIYDYYNLEPGVNLTLSKDNEVMILSMNKHDSKGENDLYVSFRVHTTLWSAPVHMGSVINTTHDELTPFISDDKQHLFFSSNKNGDQDIFVSERLDDSWTNWSAPQRLPLPINSAADDAQPFLNKLTGYLYFSSTREGSSDIYRVKYSKPKYTPKKKLVASPKSTSTKSIIRCQVVDGFTGQPISAELTYGSVDEAQPIVTKISKEGMTIQSIDEPVLVFRPTRKGYISKDIRIDMVKLAESNPRGALIKIPLDPLRLDSKISLDPVFFMRGKDRILSASYGELDRIAKILRAHASLQIRIDGHTDNIGDEWALVELSQKRATAVKRYLVKTGIQSYRIKTRGYGANRPLNNNKTEQLRALNRRVELIITKI